MALTTVQIATLNEGSPLFGFSAKRQLVRDSVGGLRCYLVSGGELKEYQSSDNGLNWSVLTVAQPGQDYSFTSNVAASIDSNDVIHLVIVAANGVSGYNEIHYYYGGGGSWTGPAVIASPEVNNLGAPDIAVATDNSIHVLWTEEGSPDYSLVHQVIGGSQSSIYTLPNNGWGAKVVPGPAGVLHAVAVGDPDGDYTYHVYCGYYNGATWSFTTINPQATESGASVGDVQIACLASGTAHMLATYIVGGADPHLAHYKRTAGVWDTVGAIIVSAASSAFWGGIPVVDVDDLLYVGFTECPISSGNLAPPATTRIYKYESSVWSQIDTVITDASHVNLGVSLLGIPSANPGYVGVFDYAIVVDAFQWTLTCNPFFIENEIATDPPKVEFYYDGQSQGSEESSTIFLPLTTDEFIYKLIGIKNISGGILNAVLVEPSTTHGSIQVAEGSSGDLLPEGVQKNYEDSVLLGPVADDQLHYIWIRWRNSTPRYVGSNIVQLVVTGY